MLDVQNHDGILTFLGGMILLVFAGLGMVMIADGFSQSGKDLGEIHTEIREQTEQITRLQNTLQSKKSQLTELERDLDRNRHKQRMINLCHEAVLSRRDTLIELRNHLGDDISKTKSSFEEYRTSNRERGWLDAIGNSLGRVETMNGQVYDDTLLVAVNDKGIKIRHTDGTAFIPSSALETKYWELFLWNQNDSGRSLKSHSSNPALTHTHSKKSASGRISHPAEDDKRLQNLRQAMQLAGDSAERLAKEIRNISMSGQTSDSQSVAGSLKTFEENKFRLIRKLDEAERHFANARAELMIHFPEDPLLHRWDLYGTFTGSN